MYTQHIHKVYTQTINTHARTCIHMLLRVPIALMRSAFSVGNSKQSPVTRHLNDVFFKIGIKCPGLTCIKKDCHYMLSEAPYSIPVLYFD